MANITDVAKLAGVSHQTVSRVLNREDTVRAATRARVDAAIRELNYRPSAAARALVTRRTRSIGLITTGAPLFGPSSIMLAFNEAARAEGYQVSIASLTTADRSAMEAAVEVLLGQRVEALVLIVADFEALDAIDGIELGVPLITASSTGHPGFHSVSIDQFAGACLATRHLIELGHRDILHIAGPAGSVDAAERERGWRSELVRGGIVPRDPVVGSWQPQSGYELVRRLVAADLFGHRRLERRVSAIFSANDQMALGALHALAEAGIAVPGDVSVMGFDDVPEAAHFSPPLTTVRQDFADLGARLMAAVLSALDDGAGVARDVVEPRLVARASTGRYRTVSAAG